MPWSAAFYPGGGGAVFLPVKAVQLERAGIQHTHPQGSDQVLSP